MYRQIRSRLINGQGRPYKVLAMWNLLSSCSAGQRVPFDTLLCWAYSQYCNSGARRRDTSEMRDVGFWPLSDLIHRARGNLLYKPFNKPEKDCCRNVTQHSIIRATPNIQSKFYILKFFTLTLIAAALKHWFGMMRCKCKEMFQINERHWKYWQQHRWSRLHEWAVRYYLLWKYLFLNWPI